MKRNIKALLCATALIGTMSFVPLKAEVIESPIDSLTSHDGDLSIEAPVTINASGGLDVTNKLTNTSVITNNGTVTGGGIVAQSIENSLSTSKIEGNGNLTFGGTSSNKGVISQGIVKITGGTLDNTGTLTANGNFSNAAEITGGGTLNINAGGSTTAAIKQGNVNVSGTFDNGGSLNATTKLTNKGTINTTANITAASLDNQSGKTIAGTGKLSVGGGSNSGTITQANMETTDNFTNNNGGNIGTDANRVNLTTAANKTLQNNGTIKAGTFYNNGTISGSGTLNVTGGTNSETGVIDQAMTSSDYTNNGNVIKDVTNTGTYTNNGTISGEVTNNGSQFTNSETGTITNTIHNNTGTFFNDGTVGTASAGVTFNNSTTATVNGTGTANISGGTNSNSFTQNNINLTGNYTNNGTMTANNQFNNASYTLSGTGSLTVNDKTGNSSNGGIISQKDVTLTGTKFTNNGSITTATNGTFTNQTVIEGADGSLNIQNGGSSSKSITQKNITIAGNFDNGAAMTSTNNFSNTGYITGTGSLSVNDGSNSGTIDQAITNTGTFKNKAGATISDAVTNQGTYTNNGTISGDVENNSSKTGTTFTNNNIITGNVTNTNGTFSNSGSIAKADGSGVDIDNYATFQNNATTGSIVANTITNTSGSFTNNGTLTATTFNNLAAVYGTGSLEVAGGTNGSGQNFTQGTIHFTGNYTNDGSMTIINEFMNAEDKELTGDGTLSITDTTGLSKNEGSIEQAIVSIVGTKFTNDKTIETVADTATGKTGAFTNSATELVNNGTITANGQFANESGAKITADAGKGTLNINNGGTSSGEITQKDINISGNFENKAMLKTVGSVAEDGSKINGTLTNSGVITNSSQSQIIADAIQNNDKAEINGGTIEIGGGTNEGSISVTLAKVTGNFANDNELTAKTLENNSDITGSGSLKVTNGSKNTGNISQDEVTVVTKLSVASEKDLIANTLSNGGTITNTNGTMTIGDITSNNTIELKDNASLSVSGQTKSLTGLIKSLGQGKTNTVSVSKAAGGSNDITADISALEGSTLVLEDGNVAANAVVEVTNKSTLDLQGTSKVVVNKNDNWAGTIAVNGGSLTVQDRTSNGALIANSGALTLETGKLQITSGSIIKDAVATEIKSGTTLEILNGGKVTLNDGDTWAHDVLDADGNITTKGAAIILGEAGSKADISNAKQLQTIIDDIKAGNELPDNLTMLNVKGLDSTGTLKGNNGVLLLGDKNLDIYGDSYIDTAVAMELQGNIKVSNGGRVSIDDNDIMSGSDPTVTLSKGGTLNYGRTEDAGLKIDASAGNLNLLGGSNLTFNSGSIADAVAIDIQRNATLTVSASTLNLDNKDHWNGNIVNTDGIINANNISRSDTATLKQSGGVLNLYNNTDLVLGSESSITNGEINITKDFTITDSETGEDKEIIGTKGSRLSITSGYDKDSQVIKGGNMTIDKDSEFFVKSGTFTLDSLQAYGEKDEKGVVQAALVNTMNGERNTSTIGNLSSNSIVNFNIDIHARSNNLRSNDQFIIGSMGDGTIKVDKWALNGDIYGWDAPIDSHIKLGNIFMSEDGSPILNPNITVSDHEVFTPIGWYKLNKNDIYKDIYENGIITGRKLVGANYTLDLTRFNPQVFRGQVATVAQWMNQLSIDEMLFNHTMLMPSFKEESGNKPSQAMANQYSAINPLFSPYQYSVKDGGLWYKMYGTFEHLNMNNGLSRVGNNAYGALIGADYGLKTLKNGWKFMPTTYIGYNGAYQYWSGMGQYQNGGQAGLMGTWYKDDFIISSILYGGLYDNSMSVHGHNENTLNYFAGSATKAAYNWRFHRDWILQPNLMASYNYFGQQNWHSDFGQMGMMAGMLHGVNIAPGVNLIWEKETFSTYLTLQYMYNINGASGGKAGNVGLPQVEMDRGFIQYGIGFTKKFTDRVSGYLQAVLRNVGRTGVGFQAGFNVKLGK